MHNKKIQVAAGLPPLKLKRRLYYIRRRMNRQGYLVWHVAKLKMNGITLFCHYHSTLDNAFSHADDLRRYSFVLRVVIRHVSSPMPAGLL